jgi:hypothetical protein
MNSSNIGSGPRDKPILVPKIQAKTPISNRHAYKWHVMRFPFLSRYDTHSTFYQLPVEILFQMAQVMDSDSFVRAHASVAPKQTPKKEQRYPKKQRLMNEEIHHAPYNDKNLQGFALVEEQPYSSSLLLHKGVKGA